MRILRLAVAAATLSGTIPTIARAQDPVNVRTVVRDSATGRVIADAVVELRSSRVKRSERADSEGRAQFARVDGGAYNIVALRIGYRPAVLPVVVGTRDTTITLSMASTATQLATFQVRANSQEIFGTIAGMPDFHAVAGATVDLPNAKITTTSDSLGNYVFRDLKAGQYVLRITAPGFAPRITTLTVPSGKAMESSHLLDVGTPKTTALAAAWFDMDRRVAMRGFNSVIIPSEELQRHGGGLINSLRFSRDFAAKGFQLGSVCVFLNGRPMPGFDLNSFNTEEVAMIEIYVPRGDPTNLMKQWPGGSCGPSDGRRTAMKMGALPAQFVVIWTK